MNNPWVAHVKKFSKTHKVPFGVALILASPSFKGAPSKTHPGQKDYTAKKGLKSKTRPGRLDYTFKKGTKSKTMTGKKDFTTKKGDKVFHQGGHNVKKSRAPYTKK